MSDGNNTLNQIRTGPSYDLSALCSINETLNGNTDTLPDSPFLNRNIQCGYHEPHKLVTNLDIHPPNTTSYFHINCRGLSHNWDNFLTLLSELQNDIFFFDIIGFSEAYRCDMDTRLALPGYHSLITRSRLNGSRGGVGLFIKSCIQYKVREDLEIELN